MDNSEKTRENRLRRKAKAQGFAIQKSRAKNLSGDNCLGYRLVNANFNSIEAGERYDLSLDEVEKFLNE